MRVTVIHFSEQVHQFLWSHHHLLLDGWSLPLILKEVVAFYNTYGDGQNAHLPSSRPYRDYIAWLGQQDLSSAATFWRKYLRGFTAPTSLWSPGRAQLLQSGTARYVERQRDLSMPVTDEIVALGRRHQLTLNTIVQGAWATLLSHYPGQEDVVFGATTSGRPAALVGVDSIDGLFINTLPVRAIIGDEESLIPWLEDLQARQIKARQYEYSPLVEVQRWSEVFCPDAVV